MKLQYLFILIFSASCHTKIDLANEKNRISEILKTERKAHFDRNTNLFLAGFADSMISVNKGTVLINAREDNRKRIHNYFSAVDFIKWDDVAEPVIKMADDGSLAYAIIQKLVILSYPDSTGKRQTDTTNYAWVTIYRKQNGEWKAECNASTTP